MPAVTFEPAVAADAEALVAIRVAAMRESLERIGRFDPARVRARLLDGFDPACTRHVLADGERVGFVVLRPDADGLLLDHLYLLPACQGRGIGAAVLADVFAQADARGARVRVGALRGSDANRFYRRHGFEPAVAADAEALVAIRVAAMRESLERLGRFDPVRVRTRLLDGLDPACTRHVLADGERVGFVVLRPDGDDLLLDHLYLLPACQGRGIGAAVLADVFAQADARGARVRVGALRGSDANRFYRRHGFAPAGESEWDLHYVRAAR